MKKQSAGIAVYRFKEGQLEVLLAHMGGPFHAKKDNGHWTFPKGEFNEDEDPEEAAKREFTEELGEQLPENGWLDLGSVTYRNGKEVFIWAVEGDVDAAGIKSNNFQLEWPPRSGKIQEFPEIDRAAWFGLPQAAPKLIPDLAVFLERLANGLHVPYGPEATPEPPAQSMLF